MEVGMVMHSSSSSSSSSQNQKMSPYYNKSSSYVGNPKSNSMMMNMNMNMNNHHHHQQQQQHLFPSNKKQIQKGLLQTPPNLFLSNSFPPYFPSFPSPLVHASSLNYINNNNPVPLLARGLSCPPPIKGKQNNNNNNSNRRTREQSLTPKKSKKAAPSNKEDKSKNNVVAPATTKASSADSPGPDPKDLASKLVVSLAPTPTNVGGSIGNQVSVVNNISSSSRDQHGGIGNGKYRLEMDVFSGPPPSSLPLPTFSLRPKLSCKALAASASSTAIDTGATDGLRRLLRLQQQSSVTIHTAMSFFELACMRWYSRRLKAPDGV